MDDAKVEKFQERLFTELNGAMSCLNIYIGHELGLFDVLSKSGPTTSQDFASGAQINERYAREWLSCLAAGEYLDYEPATGMFSLPEEHAEVLTRPDSPASAIGILGWIPSFSAVLPRLMDAFRNGGGVPYGDYGIDMVLAQGLSTRPMFVNDYVSTWIAAMPDIESRLKSGGRAVEVGCGVGWSAIALAKGFEGVRIDAVDPDGLSMVEARKNVVEAGVEDSITFHETIIEDAPISGPYDLVTAFECLHDLPYPVQALSRMRELAAPDGAVLIADEAVEDALEDNTNFMGHLFYNFSVLHCLPQAMVFKDSAATGTVITPSTVKRYAEEAGFSSVEQLPIENPQFKFYRLNP